MDLNFGNHDGIQHFIKKGYMLQDRNEKDYYAPDYVLIRSDYNHFAPVVDSQGYDTGADPSRDYGSRYPQKVGFDTVFTQPYTHDLEDIMESDAHYAEGIRLDYYTGTLTFYEIGYFNDGSKGREVPLYQYEWAYIDSDWYGAETFEAREKKIGSIRIAKNRNFPSGTSLQAYIKTNRAELRKVFGNPNMGESADGKSKGKEWNLWVGGKRVTIYDKREKDKKGTKYFNIGGNGKFGALLVAQALSIHRNERVRAKETVPQWLEDKRQYQQVKSIDEHPDLTYERAKEYEDNRGRYGAETFNVEFNEWADQELMSHGKDISFKDWAQDEGMKHGNTEITEWAQHEDESHDARYGAEEHRFMIACGRCGWNFTDEYIKNNTDGNIRPMYGDHCSCGGMVKRYDFEPEAKPKGFFKKLFGKNAESFNAEIPKELDCKDEPYEHSTELNNIYDLQNLHDWSNTDDMGIQYCLNCGQYALTTTSTRIMSDEEYQELRHGYAAEGKKRSGLLSEPFEGTSLDSGEWKGILTGFSIGLLGLFGYSKLRK
jgi:hypothetical protein